MSELPQDPLVRNFCYQLVAKKMVVDELGQEKVEELVNSLYGRFESMFGENVVESLPEEKREEFKEQLVSLKLDRQLYDMDILTGIFGNIDVGEIDFEVLMEYTLQELADQFMGT